jgi:predicted amidohydrolase
LQLVRRIIMRIALAQIRSRPGEVALNTQTIIHEVRAAAARGCEVVVFPEMSDTGYHMPTIVRTASAWDKGVYPEVATIAAEAQVVVIVGLSERVGGEIYNTIAVIGTDGELLAKYRKTHLITAEPICEQNYIRPGDSITLCTVAGLRTGLMTCYDIRFPELARRLALSGAELLVVPAAFPLARITHWETINACRAIENQVYLAAVNRVGDDEGLLFGGTSRLFDPYGLVLASASETDETLLIGEVSRERLEEVRGQMKVFADRREELY